MPMETEVTDSIATLRRVSAMGWVPSPNGENAPAQPGSSRALRGSPGPPLSGSSGISTLAWTVPIPALRTLCPLKWAGWPLNPNGRLGSSGAGPPQENQGDAATQAAAAPYTRDSEGPPSIAMTLLIRLAKAPLALSLVVLALAASGCHPWGMRLLSLEIRQGEELVYESSFDVRDDKGIAEIWDEAAENIFADGLSAPDAFSFPEPTRAHLDGVVNVRIAHGSQIVSDVSLEGIDLIRSDDSATDWRLPREEILRAKAAAGL